MYIQIDSFDISVYIFEEKKFKSWINPNDMYCFIEMIFLKFRSIINKSYL